MQSRIRLRKTTTGGVRFRHSRAIPTVMHVFEELDVAITLYNGSFWEELRERSDLPSLIGFELEHGAEIERTAYNLKALRRAERTKRTVIGQHAGFFDWFVPVCCEGRVDSILVCGPFATHRSSATDILERWRAITGRQGHPTDPEFSNYLSITLSTLVLGPLQATALQALLECLAQLIASEGNVEDLVRKIEGLYPTLLQSRLVEHMWGAARMMVDERSSRIWASPHRLPRRQRLGLSRFPERAVVGLFVSRERDRDPVEDLLLRNELQRRCVELARKAGNIIVGQVGDHGVTFLGAGATKGSSDRRRNRLVEAAETAVSVARRNFGLDVYLGVGSGSRSLTNEYQEALAAAESALARGQKTVFATEGVAVDNPLGHLRRELEALVHEEPGALPARFDRYLEAVAVRHGYQLAPARIHLEAVFEPLAESVLGQGALAFASFRAELQRAALATTTVSDLFAVYRRALADLLETGAHPVGAAHDRSLQRAEEYMRQHYAEALTLRDVAHVAGFAPAYFSVLFKKRAGVTFARRLRELRLGRARQLLSQTDLNLTRVAALAGLSSAHYLCRVFKRATGETPERFRRKTDELFTAGKTLGKMARSSGEL
jgi:AraC-like DNA-binding protein